MPMMLSCAEASRLASGAMDHPLPLGRALALRLHLMMCSRCRRYRRQILLLRRLSRRTLEGLAGEGLASEGPAGEELGRANDAGARLSPEARQRLQAVLERARR